MVIKWIEIAVIDAAVLIEPAYSASRRIQPGNRIAIAEIVPGGAIIEDTVELIMLDRAVGVLGGYEGESIHWNVNERRFWPVHCLGNNLQVAVPRQPLLAGDMVGLAERTAVAGGSSNCRANSSRWLAVQKPLPSPWTTTGLPLRRRSR